MPEEIRGSSFLRMTGLGGTRQMAKAHRGNFGPPKTRRLRKAHPCVDLSLFSAPLRSLPFFDCDSAAPALCV